MTEERDIASELIRQVATERAARPTPKVSILIVDDVPANLVALHAILDHPDYLVVEAASGRDALRCVLEHDFAVILMDVQMPGMNGFECARLIKMRERSNLIPIIFVTAASRDDAYVFQGYEAGAIDYLFKPLDSMILKMKVAVFIDLHLAHEQVKDQAALLARTNTELLEADRHKDKFLGIISHELKTPLNFITAFASLVADGVQGPVNEQQHASLDKILGGAERLLQLVDNLLDAASLQSGEFALDCAPTALTPLIEHVIAALQPLFDLKRLVVDVQIVDAVTVVADERRLTQVLNNMVANAIKFTDDEGQIVVKAFQRGDSVVVEVSDTGSGIAPSDLPKLFMPFKQLDANATRATGGTGLGLSICKSLVEAHHGQIGITSTIGQGSTFWFSLPLTAPDASPQADALPSVSL